MVSWNFTASSKADIFEAKVASAVDEANSSDSDETFVYESNPPEPQSARQYRFHSRTPSATSTISQIDHHKGRQDGLHVVVGKKSMKFATNYNSIGYSNEGSDGTVRGPHQNGRGSGNNTPHHHHIGRYGRNGHASLFDSDSPFTTAAKPTRSATGHLSQFSSKHATPRSSHHPRVPPSPRKSEDLLSYDLEGEGADDERAPLIGSARTARNRRRPLPGSVRYMYSEDRANRCCGRLTTFTSLGIVALLLLAAIIAMLVLCTKPLMNVEVRDIRNVLVSEQELMLDLHVHAINPNIIAVQISDLDVLINVRSKHVGTSELWRNRQLHTPSESFPSNHDLKTSSHHSPPVLIDPSDIISQLDGIDEGTDPIDDPATDSQTMTLGQIVEFDSPLIFEASPIRHHSLGSIGEVRLAKPGNSTEEGGSQRWAHVIQHEFELIVRGNLRYSLPFSSRMRRVVISSRVVVHPTSDLDDAGNMRVSKPSSGAQGPGSNVVLEKPRVGNDSVRSFKFTG